MDPASPTHAAIASLVDNYTHFESLHKQHPDLALHVFKEVENLRAALDNFRITVDFRTAKQQQYENITSVETDASPYEPSVEPLGTAADEPDQNPKEETATTDDRDQNPKEVEPLPSDLEAHLALEIGRTES